MQAESLIFDMDGTLWNSAENVAASWTEVMRRQPDTERTVTTQELQALMGRTMDDIAARLLPELPKERQLEILDECAIYENEYLLERGGVLYEGVETTLAALQEAGHRLFIVSNCQCGYIEAFLGHYGFGRYFDGRLCWGDTHTSKGETIRTLIEQHDITDAVYVGDIQGDCDSARQAGIRFIHAAYGFGQVAAPDAVIHSFPELLQVVEAQR